MNVLRNFSGFFKSFVLEKHRFVFLSVNSVITFGLFLVVFFPSEVIRYLVGDIPISLNYVLFLAYALYALLSIVIGTIVTGIGYAFLQYQEFIDTEEEAEFSKRFLH